MWPKLEEMGVPGLQTSSVIEESSAPQLRILQSTNIVDLQHGNGLVQFAWKECIC